VARKSPLEPYLTAMDPNDLGAHRPADDELELLDAEVIAQERLLGHHVVSDADLREVRHGVAGVGPARRRCAAMWTAPNRSG
jgi:hypothetical protein